MSDRARTRTPLARHWLLDESVDFLNHGSFGACPRAVLEAQQDLRLRLEREPVRFFLREWEGLHDAARGRLADFVGARPEDLAAVPNATTGVNTVLASLDLAPGDELLTTDHAYGACRNALDAVAARSGATVRTARVPFPLRSAGEVVERVLAQAGPRTRLALLDHVTSPTALIFPIETLVAELEGRGIAVMVDGAHGPGMLELDLESLGASWYTGNCHKWPCAPKGAAFLHARRDRQAGLRPLAVSHGSGVGRAGRSRFHDELDWPGTVDPTAFLSVPAALDTVASMAPGGWPEVRQRNHGLALEARDVLARGLGIEPPCPDAMIGSMAALPLPDGPPHAARWALETDPLQDALLDRHGIEVPIHAWPGSPKRVVRVSAHLYNELPQYERLAAALRELLAG